MTRITFRSFLQLIVSILLLAKYHGSSIQAEDHSEINDGMRFVEVRKNFPREEKNLRKWDAPVAADLDQDGYIDLVLNDHGFGIRIAWNNKGRFAKPYDLIMGDLHGISIGDIDDDSNLEMIVSRGGGSGSNARNAKIFRVSRNREFTELTEYREILKLMRGRTVKFFDGDNDGDLDLLDFAFPSREKAGQSENYIFRNDGRGQLTLDSTLPPVRRDGQKTLITDYNNDSVCDLILYGHGRVIAYRRLGSLQFEENTDSVLPVVKDASAIIEIDYDNDGDFDLFITRGKEFEPGETFFDHETNTWGFFTKRGPFRFDDLEVGDILEIENLQSQWPHKQLYLGESAYEYEFPGETHSGRDIRLVNSDALGWPDTILQKGIYLGYIGNAKWRLAGDIWSPTSGILRGVRSYSKYDHSAGLTDMLLENRNGHFVDVTAQSGLQVAEHTTGVAVADFDNNGFQDLLITRRGNLVHANKSLIYLNRGKSGFEPLLEHKVISPELGAIGLGAEPLDYNRDGKVDVLLGNERGKWHFFENQLPMTGTTNYLIVDVGSGNSDSTTVLHSIVKVTAGGSEQIRRVGSTAAAYSQGYNRFMHFGLGDYDGPVEIEVTWSNGKKLQRNVQHVNTIFKVNASDVSRKTLLE